MIAVVLGFVGAAAGMSEALLLRRAVRARAGALASIARLALPASAIVVAASSGQLVAGAAGWALGFGLTALVLVRRWA